ncbi:MAG: VTT domain-containing protein [Gemmatimonadota bacterium]
MSRSALSSATMPTQPQGMNDSGKGGATTSRKRLILILSETALVLVLLSVWIFSEGVRESTSLWVLFFYSFPSEFLVGLVPHEPVLIYYGSYHPASVVALVSVVGTVMAEGLNYSLFGLFYGMRAFRKALDRKTVKRLAELFQRFPFGAILFAGFTPVPFFPVRFLVVMTGYPAWKYLLGVFISRAPRFYLLALVGAFFEVSKLLLGAIFLAMLAVVNLPSLAKLLNGSGPGADPPSRAWR